ncbi:ABC transporter ATP-binding protein [Sinomonas susongensis]|uniref:ABC transporter ATP-binding protein n=1 Tax=Sinomonas susongensis TaxID=1324851 RepID=UPI00110833EC|nr:ABC transporter ATP-binding protein [Sinomonas susongensis]
MSPVESASAEEVTSSPLVLEMAGVSIDYERRRLRTRAVHDVTLSVAHGEMVGLVGESGSGKTSIAMSALGLVPIAEGSIRVNGRSIDYRRRRSILEAGAQAVFQSPYSSLDPAQPVKAILSEPIFHERLSRAAVVERVRSALEDVGLDPAAMERYPREFSGGQRQRISIARAMMAQPSLLICDEPTSALDLSVQAQVANLLLDLQERHRTSYLIIGHDLPLMNHLTSRLYVMYRGHIVEEGPTALVYGSPAHPYTRALVLAAPVPDPLKQRERRALAKATVGRTPAAEGGCAFAPRCPFSTELCIRETPQLRRVGEVSVACHHDEALGTTAATTTRTGTAQPALSPTITIAPADQAGSETGRGTHASL